MKIYLAGPDVFRPDALAHFAAARQLLAEHGHQALIPLDNEESTAAGIYRANLAQIAAADAVLANLNPFRGHEPDSGTCFEVGYAIALGKPVVAYLDDTRAQIDKLVTLAGPLHTSMDGRTRDKNGMGVEDFDLPLNLMLAIPCQLVQGSLKTALLALVLPFRGAMHHDGKPGK